MTVGYRNLDALVEERIARFRARRSEERASDGAVMRVFAARKARITSGAVGTAAGLVLFVGALGSSEWRQMDAYAANTYLLVGAWLVLAMAGGVAWALARLRAGIELRREPVASGDVHADLARVDAADPLGELRRAGSKLEIASAALPLAAASLLLPLTIHGLVAVAVCWTDGSSLTAVDFGRWIEVSAQLVGLAHLALLVQVVFWARSLPRRKTSQLRERIHATWARTLLVTSAVGLVPAAGFLPDGNLIVLIPALVVFATGVAFVPLLFLSTARRLEEERAVLSS
jgi:hypothetical protein